MPPKKKKVLGNPVVVGTVSTRSTRRQSIVNFEVPKPKVTRSKSAKDRKKKPASQKLNKKPKNITELSKTKDKALIEKENNALLEILQDWDDEEDDQPEKVEDSFEYNKSMDENKSISHDLQVKQLELTLSEGLESEEQDSYFSKESSPVEIKNLNDSEDISILKDIPMEVDVMDSKDTSESKVDVMDSKDTSKSKDIAIEMDHIKNSDDTSSLLSKESSNDSEDVPTTLLEANAPTDVIVQPESDVIIEENASIPFADDMLVDDSSQIKTEEMNLDEKESILTSNIEIFNESNNSGQIESDSKNAELMPIKYEEISSLNEQNTEMDCTPVPNETVFENDNINVNSFSDIASITELLRGEEKLDTEKITSTSHEKVTEKEEKDTENMVCSANVESIDSGNNEEIVEKLQSQVSEMNLADKKEEPKEILESSKQTEKKCNFMKQSGRSNNSIQETIESVIAAAQLQCANKEEMANIKQKEKRATDSKNVRQLSRGNKSTKTKTSDDQETPNKSRANKSSSKSNKDKKQDTKSTTKSTDKNSPKLSKDKTTQEKVNKEEKKEKLGKFEEVLQSLAKPEKDGEEIRRSSRIKSISILNKKTTGWGLVKSKSESSLYESGEISDSNSLHTESDKSTPCDSPKINKEHKFKSGSSNSNSPLHVPIKPDNKTAVSLKSDEGSKPPSKNIHKDPVVEARLKQFVHLRENIYKTDRLACKEAKKMVCDCFLTQEELDANEYGCGEDCLNRLLLIECGNLCTVGDRCTNKRFQKCQFAPVEVFNTDKKGLGLRAAANIPFGEFILEYVGEVLNSDEFDKRAEVYSQDKNIHYYFMALRADAIIDATMKGNISRFINHSCDPNAETQKWTVNGELRIGFFSTKTILAGEEITFDYRFQRYGKEAQKCYCGASICRGWLGEQPDSDEEDEEEEEDIEDTLKDTKSIALTPSVINEETSEFTALLKDEIKVEEDDPRIKDIISGQNVPLEATSKIQLPKKKVQKKKTRIEMFEEEDQLNEEIEILVTTGLKNQAHTLKLSRLMVRAKEPQQRAKLLRVLRRGELPCRRLFLDYHGLRLMHGYMIDAQQLVIGNRKFESLRLEMLQTLAVLPIPNKSMLQDSKVLLTVEKWSRNKILSPEDSESNSPKDPEVISKMSEIKGETLPNEIMKNKSVPERSIEDQEEEIRFLAMKLLEEWKNLKEVFKIPKKERIEQMKEHEREANKKFMQTNQNTYGNEDDRKIDRYRGIYRGQKEREQWNRKLSKSGDKPSAEFLRLSRAERRKLFALQHELKEEERKMKQREMWRQHEMNCMMIGADPRFTAPFDPTRGGFQCIWNQQIGQWQNMQLPTHNFSIGANQNPISNPGISIANQMPVGNRNIPVPPGPQVYPSRHPSLPNLNLPPLLFPKTSAAAYQYPSPININMNQPPLPQGTPQTMQLPPLPKNPSQPIHMPSLPPNSTNLNQVYHGQAMVPMTTPPLTQGIVEDEDLSQVKFAGPIPPPVKLPPKWKCAKDKYGRPYYYHIKVRKSQWEPPPLPPEPPTEEESDSSSESSTVSSDSSSDNSESDDELDDTKLLLEVRRQITNLPNVSSICEDIPTKTPSPDVKGSETEFSMDDLKARNISADEESSRPSIDVRLKQLDIFKEERPVKKKRRVGLCEEIIISPRTEEDKKQFKEDVKRYKANKEKLKRQKEKILLQTKKQLKEIEIKKIKDRRPKTTVKVKLKDKPDFNSEAAKKIKETFRTNMASTVVGALNVYRKPDCTEGRITNTQDFKHLARKLTHFVMLKEIKHITRIEELTCTDNVKVKAREFIRKYMSKFGEVYVKRSDSPDFKD